jgi:hypothetical protein
MTDSNTAHITRRIDELRAVVSQLNPNVLTERTASRFDRNGAGGGTFHLDLWERPVAISFPDLIAREAASQQALSASNQALLIYYFHTADGAPLARRWVSFSELPDGRFYDQAYQGYSGGELRRAFANELEAFQAAAQLQGGEALADSISGIAGAFTCRFWALPRVPLLAVAWPGDEDFPSAYQILFDAAAPHYLPTDVCALLGGTLARRLAVRKPTKPDSGGGGENVP